MVAAIKLAVAVIVVLNIDYCKSADLIVGNSSSLIVFTDNIKLSSIPLTSRNKNVFYNGNVIIKVCVFYINVKHTR